LSRITVKTLYMNPEKNKRIEEILSSLDGAERAQAPSFFYTRLKARMEAGVPQPRPFILRPVYIIASLLVILMLNMLVLLGSSGSADETITEQEVEQSIAAEYSINTNLTYEMNQ